MALVRLSWQYPVEFPAVVNPGFPPCNTVPREAIDGDEQLTCSAIDFASIGVKIGHSSHFSLAGGSSGFALAIVVK